MAAEARKSLRGRLKTHVGVRYGESCKHLEKLLKAATFAVMRYCSEAQKHELALKEPKFPEWLDSDRLDWFSHELRTAFRPEAHAPAGTAPPPKEGKPAATKNPWARSFDYFVSLHQAEHRAEGLKLKACKKYAKISVACLARMHAGRVWRKLDATAKQLVFE